ncbi:hypothetical protein P3T25_009831 [Paraburkholderia sp. GAS32]
MTGDNRIVSMRNFPDRAKRSVVILAINWLRVSL